MLPLRDENPTSRRPLVTLALMGLCIAVFVFAQSGLDGIDEIEAGGGTVRVDSELRFNLEVAAIPCEIVEQRPLGLDEIAATYGEGDDTACRDDSRAPALFPDKRVFMAVLTSMFLHGGLFHLGFNMLFLWIFGNNIEDRLGHGLFLAFYLAGGIAATMGHIVAQPGSTVAVVGASGAIAAVMGAYLVWFPLAPIRTLVFLVVVDIQARWFLGLWFVLQFFTDAGSGIAWVAHVAGFLYGAAMGLAVRRRTWDRTGGVGRGPYPHPIDYVHPSDRLPGTWLHDR